MSIQGHQRKDNQHHGHLSITCFLCTNHFGTLVKNVPCQAHSYKNMHANRSLCAAACTKFIGKHMQNCKVDEYFECRFRKKMNGLLQVKLDQPQGQTCR